MLSPQLDGLEPLDVLSVEEHEANCGHPLVHLTMKKKGIELFFWHKRANAHNGHISKELWPIYAYKR
jgi:hypothetical protein